MSWQDFVRSDGAVLDSFLQLPLLLLVIDFSENGMADLTSHSCVKNATSQPARHAQC
jgi:hypothetical protein